MGKVRVLVPNKVIYQSYNFEDKVASVKGKERYRGLQSLEHFQSHHCQLKASGTSWKRMTSRSHHSPQYWSPTILQQLAYLCMKNSLDMDTMCSKLLTDEVQMKASWNSLVEAETKDFRTRGHSRKCDSSSKNSWVLKNIIKIISNICPNLFWNS